jgi:tetratricopeptide (TPR) repeat protein
MIVTYLAQSEGGAVSDLVSRSLYWRLTNAVVSYAKYLFLAIWPRDLAILYPSPIESAPVWQWATALVLLSAITFLAFRYARRGPYFIVGWLFFLGTLVPVIGLVRIGSQALADRYMYIPSIGFFIAVVFGLADLTKKLSINPKWIALAALGALIPLTSLTARQIARWRDSETLFHYVLSVTSDNPVIEYNLGCALQQQGKQTEAAAHFAEAVRIKPRYLHAVVNLAFALRKQGKPTEAVGFYQRALKLDPDSVKVRWQLGEVLEELGKDDEAIRQYYETMRLKPRDHMIRTDLGVKLARKGKIAEATEQFNEALRLDPNYAEAHDDLGLAFLATGQADKALQEFTTAYKLKPDLAGLEENLRRAREQVSQQHK